ncbi:hypothetical protein NIES2100_37280 [Calothrix sp. NIES-2100]|nr:hypothetical protein NIES2100_37280 [Calothrix sp. NIES-2100]
MTENEKDTEPFDTEPISLFMSVFNFEFGAKRRDPMLTHYT